MEVAIEWPDFGFLTHSGQLRRFHCRAAGQRKIKPQRHELTLAGTHETENAGLRRKANHGAVRRVVDSVDDPIRRDSQPEWNRYLPTTID
jgi:hypothetical protein